MNELAIRKRCLSGEKLIGTFMNTGSAIAAEIAGRVGLDWCLFDMEHGMGGWESLLHQLIAVEGSRTAPIVRLPGLDLVYFKKALDMGAHGVMLPSLNTEEEARQAVAFSRYPPHGSRGVAGLNRSAHFGKKLGERLESAHENTLVIIQIETPEALENVEAIASVDGVDALFVGPMDLTVSMGIPREFEHPRFKEACARVVEAARSHGKASGILLMSPDQIAATYDEGFTLVAVGSDGGMIANGMEALRRKQREALGE